MTLGDMKRQMASMDLNHVLGHSSETFERKNKLIEAAQHDIGENISNCTMGISPPNNLSS
jgi:hypothetical protein